MRVPDRFQRDDALTGLRPGQSATIVRIRSAEPNRIVRLSSLGVVPGALVTLVQLQPAVVLRVGETSIAVDAEVAREILVEAPRDEGPA